MNEMTFNLFWSVCIVFRSLFRILDTRNLVIDWTQQAIRHPLLPLQIYYPQIQVLLFFRLPMSSFLHSTIVTNDQVYILYNASSNINSRTLNCYTLNGSDFRQYFILATQILRQIDTNRQTHSRYISHCEQSRCAKTYFKIKRISVKG